MAVYEFGKFQLDADRLLLYREHVAIGIGPKVVETLLALLEKPDTIQAKKALIDRVWPEGFVEEANLVQNIYVLRKLLRLHGYASAIETIPRRGYRFTVPVRRRDNLGVADMRSSPRRRGFVPAAAVAAALTLVLLSGYALSRDLSGNVAQREAPEARLDRIGDFFLSRRTPYGIRRSIVFFSRAIAQHQDDGFSYGSRAQAYALSAERESARQVRDLVLAQDDARKALGIEPRCGRAYAALGLIALDSGKNDVALGDFREAVAFAPGDSNAREWYGIALLRDGDVDGAEQQLAVAEQLDPLSVAATAWLSAVSYLDRRYDEAISYARIGLSMAPERRTLWVTLGLAQEAEGKYSVAMASFVRYGHSCSQCKGESAALLADAYEQLHLPRRARAELAIAQASPQGVRPEDLALALAAVDGTSKVRLPHVLSTTDRLFLANDPRIDRLSNRDRQRLLGGQG